MKKLIVALLALSTAPAVFADGFVCESRELNVKVFNHTDPAAGTRNGAVLVVADPNVVTAGLKTIASFTDAKGTLTNHGATYWANVDLRVAESARGGENIGGTKLRELQTIKLDVDFSYGAPVRAGEWLKGSVTLVKRNGASRTIALDCQRYLKN